MIYVCVYMYMDMDRFASFCFLILCCKIHLHWKTTKILRMNSLFAVRSESTVKVSSSGHKFLYASFYIISIFKLFRSVANSRICISRPYWWCFVLRLIYSLHFLYLILKRLQFTFLKPAETVKPWRFNVSEVFSLITVTREDTVRHSGSSWQWWFIVENWLQWKFSGGFLCFVEAAGRGIVCLLLGVLLLLVGVRFK